MMVESLISIFFDTQKYMEEISQKIVNDLQPVFQGFPCETGETPLISVDKITTASADRTRNVFDTLHNTVSRYKKRLTALAEEVIMWTLRTAL